MVGNQVGAQQQNQGTPPDDDTAVLADNANWAANNPARANCASDSYKRLIALNCPSEMIDQIGGWSSGKVGESYGEGFRLTHVFQALLSLSLEAEPNFTTEN